VAVDPATGLFFRTAGEGTPLLLGWRVVFIDGARNDVGSMPGASCRCCAIVSIR